MNISKNDSLQHLSNKMMEVLSALHLHKHYSKQDSLFDYDELIKRIRSEFNFVLKCLKGTEYDNS